MNTCILRDLLSERLLDLVDLANLLSIINVNCWQLLGDCELVYWDTLPLIFISFSQLKLKISQQFFINFIPNTNHHYFTAVDLVIRAVHHNFILLFLPYIFLFMLFIPALIYQDCFSFKVIMIWPNHQLVWNLIFCWGNNFLEWIFTIVIRTILLKFLELLDSLFIHFSFLFLLLKSHWRFLKVFSQLNNWYTILLFIYTIVLILHLRHQSTDGLEFMFHSPPFWV